MGFVFKKLQSGEFKKLQVEIKDGEHGYSDINDKARDMRLSEARALINSVKPAGTQAGRYAAINSQDIPIAIGVTFTYLESAYFLEKIGFNTKPSWANKTDHRNICKLVILVGNGTGGGKFIIENLLNMCDKKQLLFFLYATDNAISFYSQIPKLTRFENKFLYVPKNYTLP